MNNFIGGFLIISLIFAVVLLYLTYYTYSGKNLITAEQAKFLISRDRINKIIDVRTTLEYDAGHYSGAVNIPIQSMNKDIVAMKGIEKSDNILVYCNTGQRARRAVQVLNSYGYNNVFYIAGNHTSLQ
jgi:rhodanese-related sulfurtransferase